MPRITIHVGGREQLVLGHPADGATGPPRRLGAGDQLGCPWPALCPARAHHVHEAVGVRAADPQVVGAMPVPRVARVGGQRCPTKPARGRQLSQDPVGVAEVLAHVAAWSVGATRPGGQASCRKVTDSQSQ
jgi:hypothetical protein